ncbi:MAG TPA: hypothetical protein VHV75_15005 [Solirubrobacteraceae bacterium]|jgi:hypothetical protein|nr:hypothetical protein [Solirubrobacteraceae bacterium]
MSSNQIPVESILKIALDKSSADDIRNWLDGHEKSWSNIESTIDRVGTKIGNLSRLGMGAAGVAGLSAIASNFFNTSQAGSNLGLAAGQVTGGAGVWHGYSQSLLSAQAKTGIPASQIAQGLIQAVQAVGGNPTPSQAAILGGLIAGYGETVGLTPAQVAQVISPLLQASNKPLTSSTILGTASTLTSGLTAFPGSQAAPMLGLISQLGVSQALGSGPGSGFSMNTAGLTSLVNAAAQTNSIWRNPSITGSATSAISGGLQNAYGNPQLEAFMQMAGIGYKQQRQGITPGNVQSIMGESTKLYGSGNTRDIFLRSIFGTEGSDFLEQFSPGSKGAGILKSNVKAGQLGQTSVISQQDIDKLLNQIDNAQARTTPSGSANRFGGKALKVLESPAGALAGAGLLLGKGKIASGAKGVLGDVLGGSGNADSDILESLLRVGGGAGTLGVGTLLSMLGMPDSTSDPGPGGKWSKADAVGGVTEVLKGAQSKHFSSTKQEQQWMLSQFGKNGYGTPWATGFGANPKGASVAEQMMQKVLTGLGGGNDPLATFNQAVTKLLQYANQQQQKTNKGHAQDSSYTLGTTALQGLGSSAPGVEFAALTMGGGGSGGGGLFASYPLSPGTGGGGGSGKLSTGAPGSAASKRAIAAAAKKYGVSANVLEGIYGAESSYGTAYSAGQKTYGYFGLTSPGLWNPSMSFQQDANTSAQTLANLVSQYGDLNTALEHYSGGSYGLSHVLQLAGGKSPSVAKHVPTPTAHAAKAPDVHVHVNLGGRRVAHSLKRASVQRGHKS